MNLPTLTTNPRRVRMAAALFVSLHLLLPNSVAAQKLVGFPGPRAKYASPDGGYELRNVDDEKQNPPHTLYLRDKLGQREMKLLSYDRHVDALWSAKGSQLLITNYEGSDFSSCSVYLLDKSLKPINIVEEFRQKMAAERSIFEDHHVYFECPKWIDQTTIKVKVWGYGEIHPSGFTLWLEYKLGGDFRILKRSSRPT